MALSLLDQIKTRRLQLGLKQQDMHMRVGMTRQQYQRIESKGNPRLDTLTLVAKGLNSELMLIPENKLDAVKALLDSEVEPSNPSASNPSLEEDPWQGLLDD